MFYSGQRVVCVGVHSTKTGRRLAFINLDQKYTVRRVVSTPTGRTLVNLMEATGPLRRDGFERGFPVQCFRPLNDKKTDISVFTEMLTKVDA
ncbi:hypothetical protein [EBPR siphovirus 2]|nr:hypothetical protein [EBPR siphovirus 2]